MTTSVGSENFSREWLQPPPDPMPSPEASLYALLGRLVASEIDPDLMAVLRTPGVLETFENIAPGCLDGFDQEAAVVEFCRLFVLPGGVPAVAAAWLPGSDPNRSVAITGLVAVRARVYTGAVLHTGPTLKLRQAWRATTTSAPSATGPAG